MNNEEINKTISGLLTVEFMAKKELFKACKELGIKPIQVNKALKKLDNVEVVEKDEGVFVRLSSKTDEGETMKDDSKVSELKRTPEPRERKVLHITEEEAEGLSLLTLRTPPVKENLVYPEGVTREMYEEFKAKILENKSLIWDLVSNFNGAKGTAITMWEPENEKANKDGKVFYQWNSPETTWPLMEQLCKIINLYEAQEEAKAETEE